MCILCVIQRWSRRVAMVLPWLVIPLIGLWALSQLLPPAFRFEITSPRLACVFVLLFTLFWYEILMPQLSAWRVRRNDRLRERKRSEAIELQKLRKTATRRCRNCLTPYRDQNPGGGRFMCSYCGHISKRPVLDLPVPPGLGMSNSGIIKGLVGKSGKIFNGKVWSDNGWICVQDWLENGNWVSGSFVGKSGHWSKDGNGVFEGDEHCLAEKSYSGVFIFVCKLLSSLFLSLRWLWRKVFRISSPGEDDSSDAEHRGLLLKRGENRANYPESRSVKARRKAEEKRLARLEKQQLEEEERQQREEVARLVEERRRLREEIMEAEKDHSKGSPPVREKDSKKEAEKKRQERRREKDKGSSKSNSDVEELERKAGKRDADKRNEIDRMEHQIPGTESFKGQGMDFGHGTKNTSTTNFSRGNAGTRYLDRMRGTFLSSSKAFSGSSFFGKVANTSSTVTKEHKPSCSIDKNHTAVHRKDIFPPERVAVKSNMNGDDKCIHRPVLLETQPRTTPKKSWQQLFTRSSSVTSSTNANVISRPNAKSQEEVQSPPSSGQSPLIQSIDNPISFGHPSPFTLPNYSNGCTSSSLGFSPPIEPIFTCMGERPRDLPDEPELFEDPCYVPDPISLLGPVSESLDNFQLDLGAGFAADIGLERPRALSNTSASTEVHRPSPMSPISRSRVADEKYCSANRFPNTLRDQDLHRLPADDASANDKGTWQMWNSSPLGQDGLGLVGSSVSWLLSPERNRLIKEDFVHPSTQKTMASLFTDEDQVLSGTHSPQKVFLGNGQNGGTFSPVTISSNHDPWAQNAFYPPSSGNENHFSVKPQEETTQNELVYGNPTRSASNHPFEPPPADNWSKKEWGIEGSGGKSSIVRPHFGGLFPTSDVQSVWSI